MFRSDPCSAPDCKLCPIARDTEDLKSLTPQGRFDLHLTAINTTHRKGSKNYNSVHEVDSLSI